MNSKRLRSTSFQGDKNVQEAFHLRYRNCIAALNDLMKDVALVKHRRTLDEVAKAVTRAIDNDEKWSKKCQDLQAELVAYDSKIKIALQMSEEDKQAIETLKEELKNAKDIIDEMKLQETEQFGTKGSENRLEETKDIDEEVGEKDTTLAQGDTYKLLKEIEREKLQIFELEEELANKDKFIEELLNTLNLRSKQLEDAEKENETLKLTLENSKSVKNKTCESLTDSRKSNTKKDAELKSKSDKIINCLKKKLQDVNKRDQLSLEKVKYLIKNNKTLSRKLQITKNQNNLMKLQLAEQTKMLGLLSSQCCKLEEKDKKQAITISALERIRDKYVQTIGNLEQEMYKIKTRNIL